MIFPEEFRWNHPSYPAYHSKRGEDGAFLIPLIATEWVMFCLATRGIGPDAPPGPRWEHVSVTVRNRVVAPPPRCPTWEEMCAVKAKFWAPTEWVQQFHPPVTEHVNNHAYCLHLWRAPEVITHTPPSILVGLVGVRGRNLNVVK